VGYIQRFLLLLPPKSERTMVNNWIRRKRNSLGFGVQSPNDFYFVQNVLREKMHYYGYRDLRDLQRSMASSEGSYPEEINRLLFRLANYAHPEVIVEVGTGSGLSACAMAIAHFLGRCITISERGGIDDVVSAFSQIVVEEGDEVARFCQIANRLETIEMLHVAHTEHYQEVVDCALKHVCDSTLFVIEGIRDSKEKLEWWKNLQGCKPVSVSYDIGNVGLLFFDKHRHKTAYWVNLAE